MSPIKGRGLGFLNFPKCVFLALKKTFSAKIGFTGLGKIPKIYQFSFLTPFLFPINSNPEKYNKVLCYYLTINYCCCAALDTGRQSKCK